jgi:hypothetical protein
MYLISVNLQRYGGNLTSDVPENLDLDSGDNGALQPRLCSLLPLCFRRYVYVLL